jgi:hydroxyacylglutathione hydrolase
MGDRSLRIRGLPAFRDNYIWLLDRAGEAVVVDPGDAAPVLETLAAEGLRLVAIWLTHHHADHVGGVAEIRRRMPHVAVLGPAAESITGVSTPLSGGERFDALGESWQVLAVPGHTRGHIAYYGAGRLLCGDVLFGLGCGRLFEGSPKQMADSLARIAALPRDTAIHCAHEYTALNAPFALDVDPENVELERRVLDVSARRKRGEATVPFSLAEELATNPFLRCTEPALVASACGEDPATDPGDPASVFATLRAWRDRY